MKLFGMNHHVIALTGLGLLSALGCAVGCSGTDTSTQPDGDDQGGTEKVAPVFGEKSKDVKTSNTPSEGANAFNVLAPSDGNTLAASAETTLEGDEAAHWLDSAKQLDDVKKIRQALDDSGCDLREGDVTVLHTGSEADGVITVMIPGECGKAKAALTVLLPSAMGAPFALAEIIHFDTSGSKVELVETLEVEDTQLVAHVVDPDDVDLSDSCDSSDGMVCEEGWFPNKCSICKKVTSVIIGGTKSLCGRSGVIICGEAALDGGIPGIICASAAVAVCVLGWHEVKMHTAEWACKKVHFCG